MNAKTKKALDMLQADFEKDQLKDGEFTTKMAAEKMGITTDRAYKILSRRNDLNRRNGSVDGARTIIWSVK